VDDEDGEPSYAGEVGAALHGAMAEGRHRASRWPHAARAKGTPQGGVISPLLANLYLHHAFDMWMSKHFASNPFERYADDIIVHCNSKVEAEHLLSSIRQRLQGFEPELHPDKTKLVYCQNYRRKEEHEHNSFTFLSYSFQPRVINNLFWQTRQGDSI